MILDIIVIYSCYKEFRPILYYDENMTQKVTKKNPTSLKHHRNSFEKLYKKITLKFLVNHSEFLAIVIQECLVLIIALKLTENFSELPHIVLSIFSVALAFQCDFLIVYLIEFDALVFYLCHKPIEIHISLLWTVCFDILHAKCEFL